MMGYNKKLMSDGRYEMQNIITTIFLLYMGAVYPLIMHDRYFDITVTKYRAFSIAICIYAVLMILAALVDVLDGIDKKKGANKHEAVTGSFIKRHNIMALDIFMALFILANVMAFLMASDKTAAFTGEEGRRCGLQFMILAMFLYLCMARGCAVKRIVSIVFMAVGSVVELIALCQYMGADFLKLREGLGVDIQSIYISTFGNIDIFGSFLCVLVPVAMGAYLGTSFTKSIAVKVTSLVTMVLGAAAAVITNANLVYIGITAALVITFVWSAYRGCIVRFADVCLALAFGVMVINILLDANGKVEAELDGISRMVSDKNIAIAVFAVLAVVRLVMIFISSKLDKISGVKALIAAVIIVIAGGIAGLVRGSDHTGSLFSFDDSWGNYRGYVWRRLMESFREFNLPHKLFGYGNESVKEIMTSGYYDEMIDDIGVVYDNAHNEYLQYLVTTGFFGALAYVGLIVSAAVMLIRTAVSSFKKDADTEGVFLALTFGISGYASQAFVNLNQSLTTPYMFLMIAMAAGVCRVHRIGNSR